MTWGFEKLTAPLIVGIVSPCHVRIREHRRTEIARGVDADEFRMKGTREYERPSFDALFARATDKARCLGGGLPYASSRHAKKRRMCANDYERKRACKPYLLATNLENDSAEAIVRIYAARMQIEEMFRDTKNPRFGWGLEYSKTRSTRRFDVLLMLAALAFAAVALIGSAARELGHEPKFRVRSGPGPGVALSVSTSALSSPLPFVGSPFASTPFGASSKR